MTALALVLALSRPDLLANLLLLTFSGLDQLIPAVGLALLTRRYVTAGWVVAGLVAGEIVVTWLTFAKVETGHVNGGPIALVPNRLIVGVGVLAQRRSRASRPVPAPAAPVAAR